MKSDAVCVQLTDMTFTNYLNEFILKPANLTNTYYWIGGQGMEPLGIRKHVVSIPGYTTTFKQGASGEILLNDSCPLLCKIVDASCPSSKIFHASFMAVTLVCSHE